MPTQSRPHSPHEGDRLIFGGLLGLSAAGALQLLENEASLPLTVAAYAFAVAIPLLASALIADLDRVRQPNPPPPNPAHALVGAVAALLAVVGLGACFWHFGVGPAAAFGGSTVLALLLVRTFRR